MWARFLSDFVNEYKGWFNLYVVLFLGLFFFEKLVFIFISWVGIFIFSLGGWLFLGRV